MCSSDLGIANRAASLAQGQMLAGAANQAAATKMQESVQGAQQFASLAAGMRGADINSALAQAKLDQETGLTNAGAQNAVTMANAGFAQQAALFNANAAQTEAEMRQKAELANVESVLRARGMNDQAIQQYLAAYQKQFNLDKQSKMAFWQQALPGRVLELSYEALVSDQEGQTRRLLDHCGLAWTATCLDFHRNAAPVSTPSAAQVRRPLYRDALARWKRHADALAEVAAFFAARFQRPLVWGAFFIVGLQMFVANMPAKAGIRVLTITDPVRRFLMDGIEPDQRLARLMWPAEREWHPDLIGQPLLNLGILTAVTLLLALYYYLRSEYDSRPRD